MTRLTIEYRAVMYPARKMSPASGKMSTGRINDKQHHAATALNCSHHQYPGYFLAIHSVPALVLSFV